MKDPGEGKALAKIDLGGVSIKFKDKSSILLSLACPRIACRSGYAGQEPPVLVLYPCSDCVHAGLGMLVKNPSRLPLCRCHSWEVPLCYAAGFSRYPPEGWGCCCRRAPCGCPKIRSEMPLYLFLRLVCCQSRPCYPCFVVGRCTEVRYTSRTPEDT